MIPNLNLFKYNNLILIHLLLLLWHNNLFILIQLLSQYNSPFILIQLLPQYLFKSIPTRPLMVSPHSPTLGLLMLSQHLFIPIR